MSRRMKQGDAVLISSGLDHYPPCPWGFNTPLEAPFFSATILCVLDAGSAPGMQGVRILGGASAPELSGSTQGAAADSLGEDELQCLNNHLHPLRVGHCNMHKDKDSDIIISHRTHEPKPRDDRSVYTLIVLQLATTFVFFSSYKIAPVRR